MTHLMMIAAGGAAGALSRHWLVNVVNTISHERWQLAGFPVGTLMVNIIGSFCIGIMYVLITERLAIHADWRNVAVVGFLGAFTTFSTFSLDTVILLENGQLMQAAFYTLASVCVCMLVTWLAISIARVV